MDSTIDMLYTVTVGFNYNLHLFDYLTQYRIKRSYFRKWMIVIQWRLFVLAKYGERKHLLRIESRLMNQERTMTYLLSQKRQHIGLNLMSLLLFIKFVLTTRDHSM